MGKSTSDKKRMREEFKKRIYCFTLRLIEFVDNLPKTPSCRIIGGQLLRSGTSIGANYVEAYASSSKKDFTNYFSIALKSANESKFWLVLLKDSQKASKEKTEMLLKEVTEIANILASSILTLRGKRKDF